jgi:catechol 2,3-dioxygenase-like lactoylglutathione lyase family enzyme
MTNGKPILDLKFLSHGTIEVYDIEKSARFYQEFLGLEFVRTTAISGMMRLGGVHIYVVVQGPKSKGMPYTNHNGIDVRTREEVDAAREACLKYKDEYGIKQVTEAKEAHEVYCFYMRDLDSNWWEILTLPEGGYTQRFAKYKNDPNAWVETTRMMKEAGQI